MKTAETINNVCSELGITRADLAKRMGMLPSSFYRKLARESMTFEEFQKCLDVLGVAIAFTLRYPDGNVRSSQDNHEILLERMDMLEAELEATRKACALGETVKEEPAAEESADVELLAGRRVLLVDDNELNREIIKELLIENGLQVEEAQNGSEAVTAVKKKEPGYFHFIVTDLEMPVMDGYEATMKIRKLPSE